MALASLLHREMKSRTLDFRVKSSIGIVKVRDIGSHDPNWSVLARAVGTVRVPRGKVARLEIDSLGSFDPKVLSRLDPDALDTLEWVSTTKVNDAALFHIQHLSGLKRLALWESPVGNQGAVYIGSLPNLRSLDLGDTRITDSGLFYLRKLKLLEQLTLLNDRITNEGLVHLQRLPELNHLDLMNTLVSDEGIEILCTMNRLKRLRIVNAGITRKGLRKLRIALPECIIWYSKNLPKQWIGLKVPPSS